MFRNRLLFEGKLAAKPTDEVVSMILRPLKTQVCCRTPHHRLRRSFSSRRSLFLFSWHLREKKALLCSIADEVMTGVFNKLIAHANSSRLEVCDETVSFEKTDTAVIDASCFSSEKEFTDSLMKTFDKYAADASGYDKCCFLMQCSGGTQYVISLYFG